MIIAGGRDFSDYKLLKESVNSFLSDKVGKFEVVIISSVVQGGDMLGEAYASEFGYEVAEFPFNPIDDAETEINCNNQMLNLADACMCFWNGISRGTKQLIDLASIRGLPLQVISY